MTGKLAEWKGRYGEADTSELEALLAAATRAPLETPDELAHLHETLLFLRAYPQKPVVARLADRALATMADRVAAFAAGDADLTCLQEPEISGIAGTSMTAVFSYAVARNLTKRHPEINIDWEVYDQPDLLGPVLRRLVPLVSEDWPVEAHPPFREWVCSGTPAGVREIEWLLERLAALDIDERGRSDLYDSLQIPLRWEMGDGPNTRTRLRLGGGRLYCHAKPLIRRRDVSLEEAFAKKPLEIRPVKGREASHLLDVIMDTSAMRYRELHGFSHPDESHIFHTHAGRGVDFFYFGVPAEWRLPLRAYHGGMFFKNGVPAGYVEVLSLFERAEVGFNLYYTFREGESAWLYAQLLHMFHQTLGLNTISVDPYQIGHENDEAIDSGAFWFYRKLGFRPVQPEAARLLAHEEGRMKREPEHRSTRSTLKKLANGCVLFEGPGSTRGAWDRFHVRNIGLKVQRETAINHGGDPDRMLGWARTRLRRSTAIETDDALTLATGLIPDLGKWTASEKARLAAILSAKGGPTEDRYLRLMQNHKKLRAALLAAGSEVEALN